ncbi:Hypp2769 [Branchiostoma lanceolatum]|uniref:Hypp2769 protein n=1 Tax=Branchiostoma lanceolatum TaxID=7740 RepID=A0A8J9ZUV4_BRALA|nr:Hypp2769 [Branchiostoma lanceolatum]
MATAQVHHGGRLSHLYGPKRRDTAVKLKKVLQGDNVLSKDGPFAFTKCRSKFSTTYSADYWNFLLRWSIHPSWTSHKQNATNLRLERHDRDVNTKNRSLVQESYTNKGPYQPHYAREDRTCNIPDFNKDFRSKEADSNNTSYAKAYSAKTLERFQKTHKGLYGEQLRRRQQKTAYLRKTHFNLGLDCDSHFNTETEASYQTSAKPRRRGKSARAKSARRNGGTAPPERGTTNTTAGETNKQSPGEGKKKHHRPSSRVPSGRRLKPVHPAGIVTKVYKDYSHVIPRPRDETCAVPDRSCNPAMLLRSAMRTEACRLSRLPPDPNSTDMLKAFTQYDKDGSGFITRADLLKACVQMFGRGFTEEDLGRLLWDDCVTEAGTVDYVLFVTHLTALWSRLKPDGTYVSLQRADYRPLGGEERRDTEVDRMVCKFDRFRNKSDSLRRQWRPDQPDEAEESDFVLGYNRDQVLSLYGKDFPKFRARDMLGCQHSHAPPDAQMWDVMHRQPGLGLSTTSYDSTLRSWLTPRVASEKLQKKRDFRNKMKDLMDTASVGMGCDKDDNADDLKRSIMGADYKTPPPEFMVSPVGPPVSKYPFLDFNYRQGDKNYMSSEHHGSYQPAPGDEYAVEKLQQRHELVSGRVEDCRKTHFELWSAGESPGDQPGSVASSSYSWPTENGSEPPAGRVTLPSRERDPLHAVLKKAILPADPAVTGRLDKETLQCICKSLEVATDTDNFQTIMKECQVGEKGLVDYNEFIWRLVAVPTDKDRQGASPAASTMQGDYTPLEQRRLTSAQKRTVEKVAKLQKPVPSHLFHTDPDVGPFLSTTSRDFTTPGKV